jgi:DNA-binding transcriptional MerR regulator
VLYPPQSLPNLFKLNRFGRREEERLPETVDPPVMSIGELAERVGVPVATIRTWEQRYGLPAPARSPGGHRRYGADALLRMTAVRNLVEGGATMAAAARRVSEPPTESRVPVTPPVPLSAALDAGALEAAYAATRALLRIRRPGDAVKILVRLVRDLGGEVAPAAHDPADAIPLDLSLGEGPPLLPAADPYSVARLHLERVLPTVLEDARHMALLARQRQSARQESRRR